MLRRHRPELAWGVFALACGVSLFLLPQWHTLPSHLLWISLMLLYAIRMWNGLATLVVFVTINVVLLAALSLAASHGRAEWDELLEVPLMGVVFLAAVAHARRREAAREALSRAAAREREFVRDASHRLRTPIAIARGHAELIRAAAEEPEVGADADTVIEELDRLAVIVHRSLTLAAIEQPEFLAREPVDFGRLVVAAGQRWAPIAPRQWLVQVRVDGTLFIDKSRLDDALDALIENAVKYTTPSDRIGIVGQADGDTAVIEISNTGSPIPEAALQRIFDRFYRDETAPPSEGTGLGLAIARAVAETHGGTVTVESVAGQGVTFTLRLPGFWPQAVTGAEPAVTETRESFEDVTA